MSTLTPEQKDVINTATSIYTGSIKDKNILMVTANSGSGKTFLLQQVADVIYQLDPDAVSCYLAYNSAIAKEAKGKFTNVDCRTVHSLAYKYIVRPLKLKIKGYIDYSFRGQSLTFTERDIAKNIFNSFCLSNDLKIDDFMRRKYQAISRSIIKAVKSIFQAMLDKKIECTHSFYLKLFHLNLRANKINFEHLDLLMLDESGDVNEVILDVFLNIPAKLKIAVGDSKQNIYQFNDTINGFKNLEDIAILKELTKSFRVSQHIARKIDTFCKKFIDKDVSFEGTVYDDFEIKTTAYISRTNSEIINLMFDFMNSDKKFNLTRKPAALLHPIIDMIRVNTRTPFEIDSEFLYLNKYLDIWNNEEPDSYIRSRYNNKYSRFLMDQLGEDRKFMSTYNIFMEHGYSKLKDLLEYIKKTGWNKHNTTLTTCHSSKGLEFDHVYITEGLNEVANEALKGVLELTSLPKYKDYSLQELISMDKEAESTMFLYYVGVSRAKYKLSGATFLDKHTKN